MSNALYLIPTPIGGTGPLTELAPLVIDRTRALRCFIVENEKSAWRFLSAVLDREALQGTRVRVLDEHTPREDLGEIMQDTLHKEDTGLISEAGCPCVADPGALAVAYAHAASFKVVPLPGPSSILMALMASGFNGQNFAFNGYLPRERTERIKKLRDLETLAQRTGQTQLFMDTPYRNSALLSDIKEGLKGDTGISVAFSLRNENEFIVKTKVSLLKIEELQFGKVPAIFSIWR